jgi:hypothetical protein
MEIGKKRSRRRRGDGGARRKGGGKDEYKRPPFLLPSSLLLSFSSLVYLSLKAEGGYKFFVKYLSPKGNLLFRNKPVDILPTLKRRDTNSVVSP